MTQLTATRDDLRVSTAFNCSEGTKLTKTTLPDVVVMDTEMSDICGFQVLKSLRANHPTSRIPVIAVSSDARLTQIDAGLQAGFYRYLTKPYRLGDLLDAIDSALRYSFGQSECVESKDAQRQAGC
ncbi:MAG: response regulator [Polaromonas sp.]|nr:response regulator [Polaromonas sp.]